MQLKPVLGEAVDRLHKYYLFEDAEGKKDIEDFVQYAYQEILKRKIDDEGIYLSPPPADIVTGEYDVGCVLYNNDIHDTFGLREDEWLQHIAVLGRSGSGKTNLAFMLIANLLKKRKPFLIFDWKKNYRPIITRDSTFPIRIYTVGNSTVPFHFNPFIPPPNTEPTAWLKKLIEILAKATYVGEGVMFLLQQGIDQLYKEFGVYEGTMERYPTMKDLVERIEHTKVSGRAANWMASTQRALAALSFGTMGDVLNTQSNAGLGKLLEHPVILELDSLTSTDKVFFIESLLLWIHHYRLGQNEQREVFRHCIIIEEAHHILKKQVTGASEGVTDLLLREIRELGESIILLDQHPSQISLQALGNTYATFTMNLKSREDVNAASSYLMFDGEQKEYLNRLEVGQAIVKLQGRWTKPFLILVPFVERKKHVVSNEFIQEYMLAYSTDFTGNIPLEGDSNVVSRESQPDNNRIETPISDMEQAFLDDLSKNPLSGVVQRYKRLGLSRRKGNAVKESLVQKEKIIPIEIATATGKVVLLDRKDKPLNPGIVHEFWRNQVTIYYQNLGYTVVSEYQLQNGDYVDLMIMKKEEMIPIEIETGKSDIIKNINKCLKEEYPKIIILGTTIEATHQIHSKLSEIQNKHPQRIVIGLCSDVVKQNKPMMNK